VALLEDTVIFGIISGTLVAIGAVGFTMQYGVTNILNLAYGAIFTSSIYVGYLVAEHVTTLALLLLAGAVYGAVLSCVLGMWVLQPFIRRGTSSFGIAIITISVGLVVQYGLEAIEGPGVLAFHTNAGTPIHLGYAVVSTTQLIFVAVAVGFMVAVHMMLRHTRLGLAMRATSAEPSLSRGCGIPTERIRTISWLVTGSLCGVTGIILGVETGTFNSGTGNDLFILIAAAAILGGIGRPYGAMIGGLLIGIISEGTAAIISPALNDVVAAVVIVLVLVWRPQGLFGEYSATRAVAQ
jgi:branched-subunit amino acid ABC-type transport system permease component